MRLSCVCESTWQPVSTRVPNLEPADPCEAAGWPGGRAIGAGRPRGRAAVWPGYRAAELCTHPETSSS